MSSMQPAARFGPFYRSANEVLPVRDTMVVADEGGRWERARDGRTDARTQACLVRKPVRFARVYFAMRENAVVPRGLAAARTGHNVVDVAFVRRKLSTGVLTHAAVALPDAARSEARTTQRDLRVI